MTLRRVTILFLVLYAILTAYAVLAVIIGAGFKPFLTPLNTLLAFGFAVLHSAQRMGWKRGLLLLGITFIVSLAFETIGVATGWVYGHYHYTDKLGLKFLGLVPLLIPLAWYMMSYPSLILTLRLIPQSLQVWAWRIAVAAAGSLAMTAWDLAMDPMMVAGNHWVWEQPGAYFGIPLQNFWGWWLTIFISFLLFLAVARISPAQLATDQNSLDSQAVLSYAITGFSVIIVDFATNLPGPALVGIFAMLPWVSLSWLWGGRKTTDRESTG